MAYCQSDGCEIASPWFKLALYSLRARLNILRVHAAVFLTQDRCWSCLNTGHGMTKRKIRETEASRGKLGDIKRYSGRKDASLFSGVGWILAAWCRTPMETPECGRCLPDLSLC